jgi:hypothetical protein
MLDHVPGRRLCVTRYDRVEECPMFAQRRVWTVACIRPIEYTELSFLP